MKGIELFDLHLGEKVYAMDTFYGESTNLIAVGLRNTILVYQIEGSDEKETIETKPTLIQAINHDSTIHTISWSSDTRIQTAPRLLKLAAGGSDHNVRIFSTDLGRNETMKVLKHKNCVNSIAFHPCPDDKSLISGSDDHSVVLWHTGTGQKLQTMTFDHPIMSVVWHSEETSKILIAEKSGVIHIFNIASYKPILSLHCGVEPLLSADWSMCNSLLIVAAVRSEIIAFDSSKMTVVCKKKLPQDIIKCVKFSPFSDTLIATASQPTNDSDVSVTNLKSQQTVSILSKDPVSAISWFKKGNPVLVVGHNERVTGYQLSNK